MSDISIERAGETKLNISVGFPVTQNVWGFEVLNIFPEFDLSYSRKKPPIQNTDRYLNRKNHEGRDEISDGQCGSYWIHAWLPHGNRTGLTQAYTGTIEVHPEQDFYIDEIMGTFKRTQNASEIAKSLAQKVQEERDVLIEFFKHFTQVIGIYLEKGKKVETKEFRNIVVRRIVESLELETNVWYAGIKHLPESLHHLNNNLRCQTVLDVFRYFDGHAGYFEKYSLELSDLVLITANLYGDFRHLITQKVPGVSKELTIADFPELQLED